jgi:hypothetical protein
LYCILRLDIAVEINKRVYRGSAILEFTLSLLFLFLRRNKYDPSIGKNESSCSQFTTLGSVNIPRILHLSVASVPLMKS